MHTVNFCSPLFLGSCTPLHLWVFTFWFPRHIGMPLWCSPNATQGWIMLLQACKNSSFMINMTIHKSVCFFFLSKKALGQGKTQTAEHFSLIFIATMIWVMTKGEKEALGQGKITMERERAGWVCRPVYCCCQARYYKYFLFNVNTILGTTLVNYFNKGHKSKYKV